MNHAVTMYRHDDIRGGTELGHQMLRKRCIAHYDDDDDDEWEE